MSEFIERIKIEVHKRSMKMFCKKLGNKNYVYIRAIGTKELFKILDEEAAKEPYTYTDSTEDKIIFATGLSAKIRDAEKEGCKPIKKVRHRGGFETCHCPNCDSFYQIDRRFTITDEYCGNCGKLLDSAFRNYCSACGRKVGVSE